MSDTQRVASNGGNGGKGSSGSGKGGNADGGEGGGKKSKKKLIIIGVVGLLVVGVGAKMTILKPKAKAGAAAPVALKAGKSVDLDEQTLNLADGHFLRIKVSVVLAAGVAVTAMADIQDADQAVINEYSNKTVAELTGQAKREAAAKELVKDLTTAYPKVKIYGATYTEFLMQ